MSGYTPLFWRNNYAATQSEDSFLAGISFLNEFECDLDASEYRTWMVILRNSNGLRSPCRATFGGAFSPEATFFPSDLSQIIAGLKKRFHGERLEVLLPPVHLTEFDPVNQLEIFIEAGATIDFVERSNYLPLNEWSHSNLSKGNRKKYRQWVESSGSIAEVNITHLEEVYEIIRLNRLALGVEPSINLEGLRSLLINFPSEYSLYLGKIENENAVAAVTVRNTHDQTYVFFWADTLKYRHLSPVVAMCDFLVHTARSEDKRFLDLGAAQIDGVDIPGLVRFKSNLGCIPSDKFQISLNL